MPLFFLPYKNQSEQLGVALALIGSGWFVLLALWDVWWAGGVVLGACLYSLPAC